MGFSPHAPSFAPPRLHQHPFPDSLPDRDPAGHSGLLQSDEAQRHARSLK